MRKRSIIVRAGAMLSMLAVLVAGVTYAALQSSVTLTNNSISSATAALSIDGPDANPDFAISEQGFTFSGLLPDGNFSAAQTFSLKNDGTAPLKIAVSSTGGVSSGTYDPSKVFVEVTNTAGGAPVTHSLDDFATLFNNLPGVSGSDSLAAGATATFDVKIKVMPDAVTGSSASFSGFELMFTGTSS